MRTTMQTATANPTTKTTPPFPLFRLPGEMRNMIYREYFNSAGTWDSARTNELQRKAWVEGVSSRSALIRTML